VPADPAPPPAAAGWGWQPWAEGLVAAYLVVAAALAARWLLGQWALGRLLRKARPASARVRRLFTIMAAGTIWPLPRLRLTGRLRVPVCFGLRRPAVLLPEAMEFTDEATLRWVFAHELTHLRRRDPWSYWSLGLAQAVYFYLPWFWWIRRQVRLCQEYIADAAAAREGAAADEYAEFLVSLAKMPATPLGATGLGSSSDLFRRVHMLLQSTTRVQGTWSRRRSLLAAGGLLGAAVLVSGLGLRAEPPKDAEKKEVIITKPEDGKDLEVIIKDLDILKTLPVFANVAVKLDDEQEADKPAKSDDKGKDEKKKTERRKVIVIQADGMTVTVPFDGDWKDAQKEVEKAMAQLRQRAETGNKQRAEAIEKALKELKTELNDDQIKQLRKQIEEMRAKHGDIAEQARKQAQDARKMAEELRKRYQVQAGQWQNIRPQTLRAWAGGAMRLGVHIEKPSAAMADQLDLPKDQGLVIAHVLPDSAAAKAGLKDNDILLELDGKPVPSDPGEFAKQVREIKSDEAVNAVVLRKGKKERIRGIKLAEAKEGAGQVWQFAPQGKMEFRAIPGGKGEFHIAPVPPTPPTPPTPPEGPKPPAAPKAPKAPRAPKAPAAEGGAKKAEKSSTVSVEVKDGDYKAVQKEDDVTITVTGKVDGRRVEVSEITINEGGDTSTYKEVSKVPAKYRDKVRKLISNAPGGPVQFEFRRSGDAVRGVAQPAHGARVSTVTVSGDDED
jgi:membrane-associated protease RseP (regulator of RpoE activity)